MTAKTMKNKTILSARLLPLLFIALAVPARAVVSPFIRAGVDYSKPNAIKESRGVNSNNWKDKLDGWKPGCFAEVGVTFRDSHTIGLEAGYMKISDSVDEALIGAGAGQTPVAITEKIQIPILLNYRLSFGLGPVGLYLGASAGMMSDKAGWKADVNNAIKNCKDSNWIGLYGATAGVIIKLGKTWAIDAGARALASKEKTFSDNVDNEPVGIGKNKLYWRPNVRLALSCRW
ncbi:MAG: porin family protein [Opitutaceae bacterium]|jgi:opacity protein-like surface antigen|nr:porin family protein [Opitutaceae bacterium]